MPLSQASNNALGSASQADAAALKEVASSVALGAPNVKLNLSKGAKVGPMPAGGSFVGSLGEMGKSLGGARSLVFLAGLAIVSAAVALAGRRKTRSAD
ncbi:MAG: hypothetical protein ACYDHO_00110 [Gaiellaceae bacterium]